MRKSLPAPLRILAMATGALAFCSPLWSDVRIRGGLSGTQRICYCDCEEKSGAQACLHMCELPKYENRPWATSCHKKQDSERSEPSAPPGIRSTKDNHIQQARR
jgi:hypothetical protein